MRLKKHHSNNRTWRIVVCVVLFCFHLSVLQMLTSCSGSYVGVPRAEVLRSQTYPTYGGLHALATSYAESLNAAVKADTLHPGMYAEYGVTLALMGHKGTACRMLNAEVKAFPESRGLVQRIKQRLMPDMLGDSLASPRDTANLGQLAAWAYDSVAGLRPLPFVAPVIDSTDTLWISMQTPVDSLSQPVELTAKQKRELLEEQQAAEAQRKQFVADSIAAAKQAVKEARKQQKLEREKAKKEKEKARELERKEREKQNKERAEQRRKEREAMKAAREAEKKNNK